MIALGRMRVMNKKKSFYFYRAYYAMTTPSLYHVVETHPSSSCWNIGIDRDEDSELID